MNKLLYLLPVLMGFTFACTKEVDLMVEGKETKIVLNGVVMDDSLLRVHLTESRFVLDIEPITDIHNASLQLYEDGKAVGSWVYMQEGVYEANGFLPQAGKQYKLQVSVPGLVSAQAEVQLPEKIERTELVSVDVTYNEHMDDQVKARIRIHDPAGTDDFYMIRRIKINKHFDGANWVGMNPSLENLSTESTNVISTCDGQWGWGYSGCKVLLSDNAFEGGTKDVTVEFYTPDQFDDQPPMSDYEYLLVSSISEDYYKHLLSVYQNRQADDNPFAEPAPLYMNIEGGYGILGASTTKWIKIR